jgi:hypothetical protein
MADDDLWHVRIAADEVKILSLEKLDDLFRLDVIDADVLVWQPGMDEWLPLRVVAGIGEDAPEHVNINVSEPPPRPIGSVTSTAWPPVALPKQTVTAWPPPALPKQTVTAWPPQAASSAPPPPSARSAAPPASSRAPAAASPSAWPPAAAWDGAAPSPVAPTVSAAQFPLYSDQAAQGAIDTDVRRPGRGRGTWLVVVALAAGAAVTLYRNAMVHAAAKSIGQERSYLNLELALGGPGFGTPRAVEKMTESSRALLASLAAAAVVPVATRAAPKAEASEPEKPAETVTPSKPVEMPRASAPAPNGATKPASASLPPAMHAPAAKTPDPVFKAPKKGKKGSEFDPLNPNL